MAPIAKCKRPTARAVGSGVKSQGLPGGRVSREVPPQQARTAWPASSFQYLARTVQASSTPPVLLPGGPGAGDESGNCGIRQYQGALLAMTPRMTRMALQLAVGGLVGRWPQAVGAVRLIIEGAA